MLALTDKYSVPNYEGIIVLLQEQYEGEAWPVIVVSLSLKRTQRAQAEDIVTELLNRYPTPEDLLRAEPSDVSSLIKPLGLWREQTEELGRVAKRLTEDGEPKSRDDILEWYGIGEYVANSYSIFVLGDHSLEPNDEKLRQFLEG